MARYFTHYWRNRTWEWNRADGEAGLPLDHVAGNLFKGRGVRVGDTVYVVTVIEGELYVCGRLIVGKICANKEKAAALLGRSPETLWEADEHIVASAHTPMKFDLKVPPGVTRRLRFISGGAAKGLRFESPNYLDKQTLRGVRELDAASAAELDTLLLTGLGDEAPPGNVKGARTYYEGAARSVTLNVFERNAKARRACIAHYGADCFICGFNFEAVYGEAGRGFTHVHHLKPLTEIGEEYRLDPVADLRPVCPNCHAMIHRKVPAYTVEEIKRLLLRRPK